MQKIKLTDYIVRKLKQVGVKYIFGVVGGMSMYLNESFAKEEKILDIFNHHEQASSFAAEAYAKLTNKLGVSVVTAGPGAINAMTGLAVAWTDSTPVLFLSGQVKKATSLYSYPKVRQLGIQEINILDLVRPITKYSAAILEPTCVRYELEKAIYFAKSGRQGPVWLDIPLDVQNALVDIDRLVGFNDQNLKIAQEDGITIKNKTKKVIDLLKKAKRPIIIAGFGVRLADIYVGFLELIDKLQIPVLTSMSGNDLLWEAHPLFAGRFGLFGTRGGNFAVQNADLLLVLGSRLTQSETGYEYKNFAKKATKIVVDIDLGELNKPTLDVDLSINCDLKIFIKEMLQQISMRIEMIDEKAIQNWQSKIKDWKEKYPIMKSEYKKEKKYVNFYYFIDTLSDLLLENEIIVTGVSTCLRGTLQAIKLKKGQRLCSNIGLASMGYALPAGIGAYFATRKKRIIVVTGDGSIQMNLQELQTIIHHNLPLKIFVVNNNGYMLIRRTQKTFFNRLIGTDEKHGLSFPDILKIAKAYGISAVRIKNQNNLTRKIKKVLEKKGPVICEIMMPPDQLLMPRIKTVVKPDGILLSSSLENMFPHLSKEEILENMKTE